MASDYDAMHLQHLSFLEDVIDSKSKMLTTVFLDRIRLEDCNSERSRSIGSGKGLGRAMGTGVPDVRVIASCSRVGIEARMMSGANPLLSGNFTLALGKVSHGFFVANSSVRNAVFRGMFSDSCSSYGRVKMAVRASLSE